jgi:hypothetical protein
MKLIKNIFNISMLVASIIGLSSCTDYLDKAPEADLSEDDAFQNFRSFQGFTEEIYNCIPDFAKGYWNNSWNWGEDEIQALSINYMMCYKIDNGDFWGWQSEYDGWQSGFMYRNSFAPSGDRFAKSLWKGAWYGIRKCNLGLANLDRLTDATVEERNAIAGQLYFFRGWFHFQWMQYLGGLPYIDEVLPSDQKLTLPRLSYAECAEHAAADFRKAADLLPIDWDNSSIGTATKGNNQLRINKIMALGYLGKDLLWAGSPLMNKESTGSSNYNVDFCNRAAEAFGELLQLVESGQTQYALVDFENYSDLFYTIDRNTLMPGSTEAIFRGPSYGWNDSNWGQSRDYGGKKVTDSQCWCSPCANYVNYYGMANGLPLTDADSGFDEHYPWKDRDPRFYHDIKFDGCQMISDNASLSKSEQILKYAELYTDGNNRGNDDSRTGYFMYKFVDLTNNKFDEGWGWAHGFHLHIPWMRLADVYLMYAEAVAEAKQNPNASSSNFSKTAVDAVNVIRDRAGVEHVNAKYSSSLDGFMSELRRERAVELSYEGHRFNDLRRWLLLDKSPYNIKTSQEFTRDGEMDYKHPENNRVSGWRESTILTRNFSEKHYWLPMKTSDTELYLEFAQNPGW